MSKYIIKNCPACRDYDVFGRDSEGCCYREMKYCKDVKDCIMKQIVRMCEKWIQIDWVSRVRAYEILSMLEIKECE